MFYAKYAKQRINYVCAISNIAILLFVEVNRTLHTFKCTCIFCNNINTHCSYAMRGIFEHRLLSLFV